MNEQNVIQASWRTHSPEGFKVFPCGQNGDVVWVHNSTALMGEIRIGRWTYIQSNSAIGAAYPVKIGAFCSIAIGFYLWNNENHHTKFATTYPLKTALGVPLTREDMRSEYQEVTIGNDVWIGRDVHVLPGAKIGDGAIVGAHAVVSGELKPYGVYGGVPARLIKWRFSEAVIEFLLALKWWEWSVERIERNVAFFSLDLTNIENVAEIEAVIVP